MEGNQEKHIVLVWYVGRVTDKIKEGITEGVDYAVFHDLSNGTHSKVLRNELANHLEQLMFNRCQIVLIEYLLDENGKKFFNISHVTNTNPYSESNITSGLVNFVKSPAK